MIDDSLVEYGNHCDNKLLLMFNDRACNDINNLMIESFQVENSNSLNGDMYFCRACSALYYNIESIVQNARTGEHTDYNGQ